jgi:hypothetical protein
LVRITLAMAARATDRLWSLEELVNRTFNGVASRLWSLGVLWSILLETLPMPTHRGKDYAIRQRIGHNHWEWEAYANKGDAVGFAKGKTSGSRDDAVRKAVRRLISGLANVPKNQDTTDKIRGQQSVIK